MLHKCSPKRKVHKKNTLKISYVDEKIIVFHSFLSHDLQQLWDLALIFSVNTKCLFMRKFHKYQLQRIVAVGLQVIYHCLYPMYYRLETWYEHSACIVDVRSRERPIKINFKVELRESER